MPPRLRKAIATLGVLTFLPLYVWGAITLGERTPPIKWIQFVYYVVAGLAWGLPLLPLFTWAEGGRKAARPTGRSRSPTDA